MNRVKLSLIAVTLVISQVSCGQSYKSPDITKQQYNSISKAVKTYSYNPTYALKINWALCTYEVYVNDMLIDFSFTTGRSAGEQSIDFPQYILKSGVQKIKVKVYPKAITNGKMESFLSPEAQFSIRVIHAEYGKGKRNEAKEVYHAKLPVPQEKARVYEWSSNFYADVPYTLTGWSSGTNLKTEAQKPLETEILALVEKYINAFKEKDVQTIANMVYKREKEVAQAFFFVSGKNNNYDNGWEQIEQEANAITEMKLIKGYTIHFLGDGKVVTLLQTDGEDRDFPAIYGETKDKENFYGLYFYRPKPGAPLEVVR